MGRYFPPPNPTPTPPLTHTHTHPRPLSRFSFGLVGFAIRKKREAKDIGWCVCRCADVEGQKGADGINIRPGRTRSRFQSISDN